MVAGNRARAGDRRAAGVHRRNHVVSARSRDQRRILVRARKRAESSLGKPDAFFGDLAKIVSGEIWLENDGAGMNRHAARPVAVEALARCDRKRLDAFGITRAPRHVHFRGTDRSRHATVDVAFEIADGLLAWRVVAERDVDVRIDQAGNGGSPIGINDEVTGFDLRDECRADGFDFPVRRDYRVPFGEWLVPIAGHDCADVGNSQTHDYSLFGTTPTNLRRSLRAGGRLSGGGYRIVDGPGQGCKGNGSALG